MQNKLFQLLLLDLYWIEYRERAEEARNALMVGYDNLYILQLAILAHKAKNDYDSQLNFVLIGI